MPAEELEPSELDIETQIAAETRTIPTCGVLAGEPEILGQRCMDGGKCHHRCKLLCFRRECCEPLTASGLLNDWKTP